jgi:hypothetical protein
MLRCVLPLWLISGLSWVFIGVFMSSIFNDVKKLNIENTQFPSLDNYVLGDSGEGVFWFIQVSDLHMKGDDVNSIESFRYFFFFFLNTNKIIYEGNSYRFS